MGCLFRLFLILVFFAVLGAPVAAVIMAVDKQPMIARLGDINFRDLQNAKTLAQRYDPRTMPTDQITRVQASTAELNTLLKGATGVLKNVATKVQVTRYGVIGAVAAELPVQQIPGGPQIEQLLGKYLNIRLVIVPSRGGLRISRLAIGSLEIPDWVIEPAMEMALDRAMGPGKGKEVLSAVKGVRVAGDTVTISFQPPPRLMEDIKLAAKRQVTVSDPVRVRFYYAELHNLLSPLPRKGRVTVLQVMRPIFRLAKERSVNGDPVEENEAAILALSIILGETRFEKFVGDVRPEGMKNRPRSVRTIRIDGRHDFVQHFWISAGLTLTGGDVAANIIGELKEVKDTDKKSGFSFTDIGADRTGVRFAKDAVKNATSARKFQDALANATSERVFFPAFKDLPEGLTVAQFKRRYGDVNSPAYKRIIADIDRRIGGIALYR